jgi:hypothetical protein
MENREGSREDGEGKEIGEGRNPKINRGNRGNRR